MAVDMKTEWCLLEAEEAESGKRHRPMKSEAKRA